MLTRHFEVVSLSITLPPMFCDVDYKEVLLA